MRQRLRVLEGEAQELREYKQRADEDLVQLHVALDDATHEIDLAEKR
jgi:hypothetical protein